MKCVFFIWFWINAMFALTSSSYINCIRDAWDPVRALLNVQVPDIMGSRTPWGWGSIPGFRAEGLSIAGLRIFVRRRCRFRKFWRFLKIFTKLLNSKGTKIAFQWHFGRTNYCVRTFKKYKICARSFKIILTQKGYRVNWVQLRKYIARRPKFLKKSCPSPQFHIESCPSGHVCHKKSCPSC